MTIPTPENRDRAPGDLALVQDLLNSGQLGGIADLTPDIADEIRARFGAGESRAALANAFGIAQHFVSAVARGALVVDEIGTPDDAAAWLTARGLLSEGSRLEPKDLASLHEMRQALRAMALANNGHPLDSETLESLNRIAAATPLVLQFDGRARAVLRPEGEEARAAIGRLLAIVFEAMHDGTWQRLKRCTGDGCPHVFYDASRNRSGTWCSMAVCGNRRKVREYQARRRAAG